MLYDLSQKRGEILKKIGYVRVIIYVTDLTRITRSTQDLFELIDLIRNKKASLKSLKDTWLDLSEDNPYSQFLITVMAGVNQLE